MSWVGSIFRFKGRIGRKQFWLGAIALFIASIVLMLLLSALGLSVTNTISGKITLDDGSPGGAFERTTVTLTPLGGLIHFVLLAWPVTGLMIVRRHDRGSQGIAVYVLMSLGLALQLARFGGERLLTQSFGVTFSLFALAMLIICGFLKGTKGDNAYGPDPLA